MRLTNILLAAVVVCVAPFSVKTVGEMIIYNQCLEHNLSTIHSVDTHAKLWAHGICK